MAEKKEYFFEQHMLDLANQCYYSEYPVFSDFMTTKEHMLLIGLQRSITTVDVVYFGGSDECEHVIAGFFPKGFSISDYLEIFPVTCLMIRSKNEKYAQSLTHRDYLGAILNLGMERSQIGDIRVDNQSAFVFCKNDFASFIAKNLTMIKHTTVTCHEVTELSEIPKQQFKESTTSIASLRLDNVIAAMIGSARGKAADLIRQGYVIANHEERSSVSFTCKNDMLFTIRGYGKFRLSVIENDFTKKGKQKIKIYKYM